MIKGKDFWDNISSTYSSGRTNNRKFVLDPALIETIGNVKGKKILDIACGPGDISILLAQKGAICTGIDFSEKMIQKAKEKAKELNLNIDYKLMDSKDIDKIQDKFDVIVIVLMFPFISNFQDFEKIISDAANLLNPGEKLVIGDPHPTFDNYMENRLKTGDFNYFKGRLPYEFHMTIDGKTVGSEAYHWTLTDYTKAFSDANLCLKRIIEPKPIKDAEKEVSSKWLEEKNKYPHYIIFECTKS
ncbi:MAG: class I SAM-dependent methyltransferase [Patescibacteria group bacterium]|nr:class I SAM-dependent methyltransferase [Patescibacteria group bacterium]